MQEVTGGAIGRIEGTTVEVTLQRTKDTVAAIEIGRETTTVLCVIGVVLVIGNAGVNLTWVLESETRSS